MAKTQTPDAASIIARMVANGASPEEIGRVAQALSSGGNGAANATAAPAWVAEAAASIPTDPKAANTGAKGSATANGPRAWEGPYQGGQSNSGNPLVTFRTKTRNGLDSDFRIPTDLYLYIRGLKS